MKAKLKHIHSPDVDNLMQFTPLKENNFSILLQLVLGPINEEGEETFDVLLCTPQWLMEEYNSTDIVIGRHHLFVFEYNYQRIYDRLKELVENIEADTWEEIATYIGRIGKWEFEDYKE